MKLKNWASIAEMVASLAVIISLALLVLEVRGNTLAVERQINKDHVRSILTPFIDPPILLSAMKKIKNVDGHDDYVQAFMESYDLDSAEAYAWGNFLLIIWMDMEQDFVENGPSDRLAEQIRELVRHPDVTLFLENFEFSEVFNSYIESLRVNTGLQ
jgi:type III secretory pathway component EscR